MFSGCTFPKILEQYKLVLCPDKSEAMSTCTSTLLVVVFNGLADGVMDDKPDIGLVDTHSKRYCGYHHLENNTITYSNVMFQ